MSGTQIDSEKIKRAREWCTHARELLGGGYAYLSSWDSVYMDQRIREVYSV